MTRGRSPQTGPQISLWHPFTARSIGWDEGDLLHVHSHPHVEALRVLTREGGARCRIEYLTDRRRPATTDEEIPRRFWPRSARWRRRGAVFRWEWSTSAVVATLLAPADVTIFNMSGHGSPLTRGLARVLAARGRPYVAMVGGFHATLEGPQLAYYRKAAACAVHTNDLSRRLVAAGIDGERVHVVALGVDTDHFVPGPPPATPTILYVGRFVEQKGLHHLVEAMPEILAANPEVRVRLVGPGHDATYAHELHARAEQLGVAEALSLEPPRPHADLPDLYRSATIFVLPSESEGFGMVMLEAMACGVPVVGFSTPGGPAELISDGVDGALTSPADLAQAILGLLDDPDHLASARRAARRTVEEHYTPRVTAEAFAALVDQARGG